MAAGAGIDAAVAGAATATVTTAGAGEWVFDGERWARKPKDPTPLLIALDSAEGQQLLAAPDTHHALYGALRAHFVKQKHNTFCGVASATMALNALLAPPPDPPLTEQSMFAHARALEVAADAAAAAAAAAAVADASAGASAAEEKVYVTSFSEATLRRTGTTLAQLTALCHTFPGVRCSARYTDALGSAAGLSALLRVTCAASDAVAFANYDMSKLGQPHRGHISPIAAYQCARDAALVLDVWSGAGLWVAVADLWRAMCVTDNERWKMAARAAASDDPTERVTLRGALLLRYRAGAPSGYATRTAVCRAIFGDVPPAAAAAVLQVICEYV